MRYRKLSPTGDYVFGHSQQDFLVNSAEAVGQLILTSLQLLQGEMFTNTAAGVPWTQEILGSRQGIYDQIVRSAILAVDGVVSLDTYSSSLNDSTRVLTIDQVDVTTVYGPTSLTGVSIGPGGYGGSTYGEDYGE